VKPERGQCSGGAPRPAAGSVLIEIDPNVRVRGNKTYAGFEDVQERGELTIARPERATAPVAAGDKVLAWESEDDIVTDAVVVDVDLERRIVYLAVDWHGWRERAAGGPDGT
jgi:hypothetical protein